jgi:hypothetical protein
VCEKNTIKKYSSFRTAYAIGEYSMNQDIINWLLEGEPWVRYRTLKDVLSKDGSNAEVTTAKRAINNHASIKQLFVKQNRNGYWGTSKDIYTWWPKKDTTFWVVGVLADFGFTKENRKISRAAEYVLSTQLPYGGFGCAPPPAPYDCFTGILTESLAKLGYTEDRRLKRAYEWLIQRQRRDGGFWCKNTGLPRRPREHEPSCAFATLCVLGALAQNSELKNSKIAMRTVEFLLTCWDNRGKIKYAGHDSHIGKGWEKLKYPFTDYRILKYLDILSQFEFIKNDARMDAMVDMLVSKQDRNGSFYAESIHNVWANFDFGQKELPSRWITFLVKRIEKRFRKNK